MYLGIDPGMDGALVALSDDSLRADVEDMPTLEITRNGKRKRDIDMAALIRILENLRPTACFIELVGPMPGQGITSSFTFGRGLGRIEGVLAALEVPVTHVAPRVWKKALQVPAGKDGARARASQLLPHVARYWPLKKHDGRAEAALIALYGYQMLMRGAA